MIFLDNEEGDLGRRGPPRGDWREGSEARGGVAVWQGG